MKALMLHIAGSAAVLAACLGCSSGLSEPHKQLIRTARRDAQRLGTDSGTHAGLSYAQDRFSESSGALDELPEKLTENLRKARFDVSCNVAMYELEWRIYLLRGYNPDSWKPRENKYFLPLRSALKRFDLECSLLLNPKR